ncbi:voltage-gated potassium channel [Aureococcus anophagefferens]|nr:voltage-gated potassium channel [Aureococcus anophagefferens]
MRDPAFIQGRFSAHATLMAVCADEMVACLEETAGLGPNVDQSAVGLSLEADSAALRPVLKKLEGLLARIEERRVRSLRLAEIDGDGVITYGEPGGATTCRAGASRRSWTRRRRRGAPPSPDDGARDIPSAPSRPTAGPRRSAPCASRGPSPRRRRRGSGEWKEEGVPSEEVISVKTAHAAIGHATLHSARHTEKHGDESKEPARPRTARDAKAPRTHTMMLQSEAGKAAQTTELLFRALPRDLQQHRRGPQRRDRPRGARRRDEAPGREMAPEAVKEMMAKFDKDGDGNLDMDEFGNMAKLKKRMVQTDGIAMPDNTFVQIWDIMVLLLILVLFPLLPLMLAFPVISKTMRQFDTYCDIVFVVDIVKNFHVGYVDANDVLHMDRKEIARTI